LESTTFALSISREKIAAVRGFVAELLGARRAEFERSWQDKGITRESAWLQQIPDGALVLVRFEAHDLERAFGALAASGAPFDRWYRERVLEIYGVDLTNPSGPNELLADWQAP